MSPEVLRYASQRMLALTAHQEAPRLLVPGSEWPNVLSYRPSPSVYPPGWHDHYELAYVDAGTCAVVCDATPYALGPHSLCIIPAGCPHYEVPSNPEIGYRLLWVKVRQDAIEYFATEYSVRTRELSIQKPARVKINTAITTILDCLCREVRERAPGSELVRKGYLLALVGTISREVLRSTEPGAGAPQFAHDPVIDRAIAFMTQHHGDPELRVEHIARHVGLSVGYFSVYFRSRTGVSPYQYLLQIRLARARELVLEGRKTIAEVAEQVGFSSPFHFSRTFKKVYATAPSALRNRLSG